VNKEAAVSEHADVLCETRDHAYWITINRAEKRNALNDSVIGRIADGYAAAEADANVRVVVLTGRGDKAFCAGADLDPGRNFDFDTSIPTTPFADLFRRVKGSRLPSIARINGACVAGGMGLLCMADLAVAADHAVFGLPEIKVGLFPMQVLALLKSLVLPRVLHEWCLTGERFDAATALRAGIVNYVVPAAQLDDKVAALVAVLAANSPTAVRRGKYVLDSMEGMSFKQAIAFAEGQIVLAAGTQDAREGIAAFSEHRPPKWTGR
jgi:methylglutaconyl-CoA hydratase